MYETILPQRQRYDAPYQSTDNIILISSSNRSFTNALRKLQSLAADVPSSLTRTAETPSALLGSTGNVHLVIV